MLARYKQAGTLGAIVEIAAEPLDPAERRYLEQSVAAKLLELTSYRPYDLETDDCRFIGKVARATLRDLPADLRGVQSRHVSGAAARLAAKGQWRDALRLLPANLLPGWIARTALRVGVPKRLRPLLQRRTSREALSK